MDTYVAPRGRGQPTALTPSVERIILEAVRKGNFNSTAAKAAGISYQTWANWKASTNPLYVEFFSRVAEMEAVAEMTALQAITNKQTEDWKAAAYILEHRYSKRWGKQAALPSVTATMVDGGTTVTLTLPEGRDNSDVLGALAAQVAGIQDGVNGSAVNPSPDSAQDWGAFDIIDAESAPVSERTMADNLPANWGEDAAHEGVQESQFTV